MILIPVQPCTLHFTFLSIRIFPELVSVQRLSSNRGKPSNRVLPFISAASSSDDSDRWHACVCREEATIVALPTTKTLNIIPKTLLARRRPLLNLQLHNLCSSVEIHVTC